MSTEALGVGAQHQHVTDPDAGAASVAAAQENSSTDKKQTEPSFLHSPPDSNNAAKSDASDSELSDLDEEPVLDDATHFAKVEDFVPAKKLEETTEQTTESKDAPPEPEPEEDDIGEVLPDHWSGKVAVFKPTMHQFKDFKKFMDKVNPYGMQSGIIKIIPPEEWKSQQPPLDDMIKTLRVREPIKQDIMGSNGTYRQVNILHGRSYNVPQWRQLCEQSEHQPPARRGERRANAPKPKTRPAAPKPADSESSTPKKRGRGKPKKGKGGRRKTGEDERPMTPVSPKPEASEEKEDVIDSVEKELGEEIDPDDAPSAPGRMGAVKGSKNKTQSVSARRKYQRREGSAVIDEAAFKDFDYRMDLTDYTPERCEELERAYWKTLTYAAPLYGADMMGTLFDERTESWNLNKLPNLLDVLGTKIPGVNTAYLYFGMWKATFAWHLEDVDLYSINYVHFGAPKQWYSISQADARRFEGAMKNIWPADAKACSQFLRHKGFLISPQHLLNNYNIQVNKVVSYPGEFVVTFPYGYHSGYNLGYNCAEAVNFALEPWLEMGKIAKRCECAQAQDSVWINVYEIERKLRGEETEYEETEEEDDEDEDEDEDETGLPSPPNSHGVKIKLPGKKRKRAPGDPGKTKVKKIKLRLKTKAEPPCCLCPNDIPSLELLPTDDGRKVHRLCALYLPETYIDTDENKEVVFNVNRIHKDRTELKCLYCRSKRGACFQCSQGKCARAYHATCAAAAGVFIEEEEVPVFGDDKVEYKEQAFEFSCRFHRSKRDKKLDGAALEEDERIRTAAQNLKTGDICQFQYFKGDIFAGIVAENRAAEQTLLVDVLPGGDRLEVEWKWLLLADPADYHLPKASANAIPMPTSRSAKDRINGKRPDEERPRKDDPFTAGCTWAEFNYHELERNKEQVKVDLSKPDQLWHFIGGKGSTDTRAQYTEDPRKQRMNPRGNFLDTVPKAPKPVKPPTKKTTTSSPAHFRPYAHPASHQSSTSFARFEKPYVYKPKQPLPPSNTSTYTAQRFAPASLPQQQQFHNNYASSQGYYQNQTQGQPYSRQVFELKPPQPAYTPMQYTYPTGPPPQNMEGYWSYPPQLPQQGYGQSSSPQQGHEQYSPLQQQNYGQPGAQHGYASSPQPPQQSYASTPATQNQKSPQAQSSANQDHTQSSEAQEGAAQNQQARRPEHSQAQPQVSLEAYSQGLRPQSTQSHCYSHTPLAQPAPKQGNSQSPPVSAKPASTTPTATTAPASSNGVTKPAPAASQRPKPSRASGSQSRKSSSSKFSWSVAPSVYQEYPFFQINHNRDASKYRTPYAPQGGFVNGYEGDLKTHIMENPSELTKKMSQALPPRPPKQAPARPATGHNSGIMKGLMNQPSSAGPEKLPSAAVLTPSDQKSDAQTTGLAPAPAANAHQTPSNGHAKTKAKKGGKKKTEQDIKSEEVPLNQTPVPIPQPGSASALKQTGKAPPKESPVPLPANFLAAMGPPPSASASPGPTPPPANAAKKTASKRKGSTNGSAIATNGGPSMPIYQTTPSVAGNGTTTPSTTGSAPSTNGKISTTPIPIPRLPGMTPHQAAAQAMKQTPIPAPIFGQAPSSGLSMVQTPSPVNGGPMTQATQSIDVAMPDAAPLSQVEVELAGTQEFPDVPGSESMEFMEKMMANLRRVSHD